MGHDETGAESIKESTLMLAFRYLVRLRGKKILFNVLISPSVDFTPGTRLLARCVYLRRNDANCLVLEAVWFTPENKDYSVMVQLRENESLCFFPPFLNKVKIFQPPSFIALKLLISLE